MLEAHASAVASGEIDSIPAIELAQHSLDERRVAAQSARPEVSKKLQVVVGAEVEEPDSEPVKDVWADEDDVKTKPMSSSPRAVVVPPSQALSAPPPETTPQAEPKVPQEAAPPSAKPSRSKANERAGKGKNEEGETHYYFYQSADGQHIFLQPLAFRCLLKEHGSVERLPKQVEAKIEFMEEITLSEATRKRWKKIVGHLPLSTAFQFCDIDLSDLVSKETLTAFGSELEWRKAKREKKRKERGDGSVQSKPPPEPSSWGVEYADLPAEVRMALTEEEVKEAVNMERGETLEEEKKEKEEPASQQTKPKPAAPRKDQQNAAASPKASPPAVPSFLQILNNTAATPSKAAPKGAPGKVAKKGQHVFSNNSSRRY